MRSAQPILSEPALFSVHPLVLKLMQHYAGWCHDYTGDDIDLLFLPGQPGQSDGTGLTGDLELYAHALASYPLMDWEAWDAETGTRWNPFTESYQAFKSRFTHAEPLVQPCTDTKRQALRQFLGL